MGAATPAVKIQLFLRASDQRAAAWRDDKPRMERTIAVFEALVANDPEHRFHRHFAQLGYALKDKQAPDLESAIEHLTEAIDIRGERGFPGYEFNRAECRLRQGTLGAADPQRRALILDDLRVAAKSSFWFKRIADPTGPFLTWLSQNAVTLQSLRE